MNYLAHLFLSQPTVESRVGNLLGDFAKGVDASALPHAVQRGLVNHRFVDHYTDSHPEVRRLKQLMSIQRRRFSGIMLDLVFDHLLIRHWSQFSEESFPEVRARYYTQLQQGQTLMPEAMQQVTTRVVQQDWFSSYIEIEGIGFALDRISDRIRFKNNFSGSVAELKTHYDEIDSVFLQFFPQLLQAVKSAALE